MEILITQTAKSELDKLIENNEHKNIRIITKRPSIYENATFDFELDEIKKDDIIFDVDGYKVIINVNLAMQLESISISYGGIFSRDKFLVEADLGMFR